MRVSADAVNELLSLHASRQFARMESRARTLLDGDEGSAIVHELLGMALAAQNRHADALVPLRQAVAVAPDDAQFWENLALCQRQLGDFVEAERSLRKSLALRPISPETANALGSVLRSLRRHEEALQLFRQALSYNEHHAAAAVNLGNTLRDLGRMAEAEASYRRAIAIDPGNARAHCYLGIVLNETGRPGSIIYCCLKHRLCHGP